MTAERAAAKPLMWPMLVLGAWAALVIAGLIVERVTGRAVPTCMFKRVTGHPCATCGSTRAVEKLIRGDVLGAIAMNPMVMALLAGGAAYVAAWAIMRRPPRVTPVRASARWMMGMFALAVFAANWAYVVWRGN